jgi:hypothetical protein
MNAQRRKEMKRKSLKKELRQAKILFWKAEAKLVYWIVRLHRLPIIDRRWGDWYKRKELARHEMVKWEEEWKLAQYELDHYNKLQKKGKKKHEGKKSNKGNQR